MTAEASPLFSDFLVVVSVSSDADGLPTTGLRKASFTIAQLASLNHASVNMRDIKRASQGPPGFFTIQLNPAKVQPNLPPGHYVLGVIVKAGPRRSPSHGQAVAVGDIP